MLTRIEVGTTKHIDSSADVGIGEIKFGRIDVYLAQFLQISRNQAQKLISGGFVKVNSKPASSKYQLQMGDLIECEYEHRCEDDSYIKPQNLPLDIIYEDIDVAVINKPKGMVVHIDDNHSTGTLVNALLHHFKNLSDAGGSERLGIVHRLDKDTTGAIVIAKNNLAYKNLKAQFQARNVKKKYITIVRNAFKNATDTLNLPIGRHPKNRVLRCVNGQNPRDAITKYEVISQNAKFALVECDLLTGRTHQIRVHMKHIGHPILGDNLYGIKTDAKSMTGQYLHSYKIGFNHIQTGEFMEFTASIPQYFSDMLNKLQLTLH